MNPILTQPDEVIRFWFEEIEPRQWWVKDPAFDQALRLRFLTLNEHAARCELWHWRASATGRLAEIIVLDQFSRNMFRDQPQAFATDALALCLAQELVASGLDQQLPGKQRTFAYMPFMHSESLVIHDAARPLFEQAELAGNLESALRHRAILERFGRYPHRNTILNRVSTPEEIEFLTQPGSSF